LANELTQLAEEEKELKQELKGEQSGAPGTDTQQQSQGIRKQGVQHAKLQQLQQQEQQRQGPPHKLGH
jgi:hypothetical protein